LITKDLPLNKPTSILIALAAEADIVDIVEEHLERLRSTLNKEKSPRFQFGTG
jgi:hypothetical protein